MALPYGWSFAALCVFQGALVAAGWRQPWRLGRSRMLGLAVPVAALATGLLLTRHSDWSTEALARLATFGAPLAALLAARALGWRPASTTVAVVPLLFLAAWRLDGTSADMAGVLIIGLACLALAATIAASTSPRAIAAGLIVLAIVDSILVFTGQVAPSTDALHAVVPPSAGGHPLPALQDATLDGALFGWLDILAPALAGMLFVGRDRRRSVAAAATAGVSLAWGLLLAVTDTVPGTVPPLAAVVIWLLVRPPRSHVHDLAGQPLDYLRAPRHR